MARAQKEVSMELTEDQMRNLIRNALMVAGMEMGEEGDHWPVIKNTVTEVMKDWERLEIERRVHKEMKKHLYEQLAEMEEILAKSSPEEQRKIAPRLKELREVYDAFFTDVEGESLYLAEIEDEEETPIHIRRAEAIIDTLEEDDA